VSKFSLPSQERLKSTKSISQIFVSGSSLNKYPLLIKYHLLDSKSDDDQVDIRVAFTVSKRNFKRAVDRNLIKRRMREMHRHLINPIRELVQNKGKTLEMVWVYSGKELKDYSSILEAGTHLIKFLGSKRHLK